MSLRLDTECSIHIVYINKRSYELELTSVYSRCLFFFYYQYDEPLVMVIVELVYIAYF